MTDPELTPAPPPVTADPDAPERYLLSAQALSAEGRTGEAEALLREGMARFPAHEWMATVYGDLLNRQERWDEAAREWRRQVARFPDHAPAHGGLATALAGLGERAAAEQALADGTARCRDVDWLRVQHAQYVQAVRGCAAAAGLWSAMAADFPDLPYPVEEHGRALLACGDPAAALEAFRAGMAKWHEHIAIRVGALESLLDLGRAGEALEPWRALRRLEGEGPRAIPLTLAWRLYVGLEGDPTRSEPLHYLLSEPEAAGDWRPVAVESVRLMAHGHLADWVWTEIRGLLGPGPPAASLLRRLLWRLPPRRAEIPVRPLLHRMLWSVIGGTIRSAEAEANLRDALERGAWATQVLVHNWSNPDRTPVFARAVRRTLPGEVRARLADAQPRYDVVLQALKAASAFHERTFEALVQAVAAHFATREPPAPGGAAAAAEGVARAHRRAPGAPAVRRARLKIAVCISGQMRGYRDAFPSWRALGLGEHDARYFVHTWKRVGGKPPEVTHAHRTFQPRFARAYADTVARLGPERMAARYPSLVSRAWAGDPADVEVDELRAFYGAAAVGIDDEAAAPFAGRSNFWKMHYKVREAHRLAVDSGEDFDLYIRIRPDREVLSARGLDWRRIHARSAAERLIYVDEPRAIQINAGYAMGDQFAAGARAGMDAYAGTFDFVEAGDTFGVPREHVAHHSVAVATFHKGVRAELASFIRFGAFVNASKIPDAEVEALLREDLASRPADEIDERLLMSCRAGQVPA